MSAPFAQSRPDSARGAWPRALALAAIALLAYLPALRAGFIWDDDTFLILNPLIRASDGLRRFWLTTQAPDYFPATYSPLWVEWRLWGAHAAGYHAVNVGLHVTGVLLLWAVLSRLKIPGAWLAAALFAVHPVNVESVAWITQRKNLMALVFYLLSVRFFLRAEFCVARASPPAVSMAAGGTPATAKTAGEAACGTSNRHAYPLSLLCFVLAMLSKGSVAMLPFVLLGIIAWRRRLQARDVLRVAPFFAVAGILVLVDIWFQKHGSGEVFRHAGFCERLLGAAAAVWFYLGKALAPVRLAFIYPQWQIRPTDPRWWIPLAAAAGLSLLLWRLRGRRLGRAALFTWGYFCLSLFPVLGFTDVQFMQYSLVADHYEQLALIGVLAFVGVAWARWEGKRKGGRRKEEGERGGRVAWVAAGAAIGVLACLTWRQCGIYRDAETLYRATLARNPGSWLAESNLGSVLYRSGRIDESIPHYEAALRLQPDLFEAQNDLGLALTADGRLREALGHFEQALRIHPDNAAVLHNAGNALAALGRLPEAVADFARAVSLTPQFAEAQQDLGAALAQMGRLREAVPHFQEALRLRPADFEAHANLGMVLARLGQNAEARLQLEAALRLQPDNAMIQSALAQLPRE